MELVVLIVSVQLLAELGFSFGIVPGIVQITDKCSHIDPRQPISNWIHYSDQ